MQASPRVVIIFATLTAALGLFYILFAAGVFGSGVQAPDPDQTPRWLGIVVGAVFLLGGTAAIIQTVATGGNPPPTGVPPNLPAWLHALYISICIAIPVLLSVLFAWVGFGPGERHFDGNGAALFGQSGGRIAFGTGAILTWLVLIWLGVRKIRQLFKQYFQKMPT
jgi:hypothetical protein